MPQQNFDCESCGAYGSIDFAEGDVRINDIAFCPFCGADIEVDLEELDFDDE